MMKFIPFPEKGIVCSCGDAMFISYTPNGGDYDTCPVCGYGDYDIDDNIDYDSNLDIHNYCRKCKILYDLSCVHAVNGCTSDYYYGKLVKSFKFNGIEYQGCPIFDSHYDYVKCANLYELEWICSCKSNCGDCKNAAYLPSIYTKDKCKNSCYNNMAEQYSDMESNISMYLSLVKYKNKYSRVLHELRMKIDKDYATKNMIIDARTYNVIRIMLGYPSLSYSN